MGIKTYSPVTPGLRQKATLTFENITTDKPEKSLTKGKHQKSAGVLVDGFPYAGEVVDTSGS
jgi:ribosomal protein L2